MRTLSCKAQPCTFGLVVHRATSAQQPGPLAACQDVSRPEDLSRESINRASCFLNFVTYTVRACLVGALPQHAPRSEGWWKLAIPALLQFMEARSAKV